MTSTSTSTSTSFPRGCDPSCSLYRLAAAAAAQSGRVELTRVVVCRRVCAAASAISAHVRLNLRPHTSFRPSLPRCARSRRLTRQAALPQTGCLGTCFPCVLSMEIAAEAQTQSLCHCLATSTLAFGPYFPVYLVSGCLLRRKFRRAKHIKGGVLDDCCCGGCCHWLNLCQMAREIIATRVHAAPPV